MLLKENEISTPEIIDYERGLSYTDTSSGSTETSTDTTGEILKTVQSGLGFFESIFSGSAKEKEAEARIAEAKSSGTTAINLAKIAQENLNTILLVVGVGAVAIVGGIFLVRFLKKKKGK